MPTQNQKSSVETLSLKIDHLESSRIEDRDRHHKALNHIQIRIEKFEEKLDEINSAITKILQDILTENKKTNGRVTKLEVENENIKSQKSSFITKDSVNGLMWAIALIGSLIVNKLL